ncbi:protein phosphatase 2C domain-containing protein [Streptomyces sp. NPDC005562]|uniref:protein phosphatase 2C domain-containing protein n=1 Tax=Streptomyces sp. NPDC005562 TaxID=3154890 RepID=UPI0033BCF88B
MSQQGDTPADRDDDWWGQLYDDAAPDTGPAAARDTLDDRFASAADAVGCPAPNVPLPPPRREGAPGGRQADPSPGGGRGASPGAGGDASPGAGGDASPGAGWGPSPGSERTPSPGSERTPSPGAGRDASPGSERTLPPGSERTPWLGAERTPLPEAGLDASPGAERTPSPGAEPPGPASVPPTGRTAPTPPHVPAPASPQPWPPAVPEAEPSSEPGAASTPARGSDRASGLPGSPGAGEAWVPAPPEPSDPPRPPAPAARPSRPPQAPQAPPSETPTFTAPAPWAPPSSAPGGPVSFPAGPTGGARTGGSAPRPPDAPAPVDPHIPHVGDGPPTYEAEPTVLPAADPDDLGDLVADTVLDGARYGSSTLRAASVRGDSARYRGEPRRDSLLTARFGSGDDALVLVAMATGARATPGAHRAAAEACQWIGRAVGRSHRRLAEDLRAARRGDLKSGLHRLTDRSLGRLRARAADLGLEPEEYAASLRCLLLPADPRCRTRVFFGVGTGGLFRLRDGAWQDIEPRVAEATGDAVVGFGSPPDRLPEDEHLTMDLGISTPPSPYEPAPEPPREPFRFRASVARPGDALVLCSGGLAEPLRGEPELAEHLTRRWEKSGPPGLAAFLADIQVRVKGYADDRTAAAVWEA